MTKVSTILYCLLIISNLVSAKTENNHEFKRLKQYTADGADGYNFDSLEVFFQLLNGLKADDYVPGSINCSLDVIASNQNFKNIYQYFSFENDRFRPRNLKLRREDATFTVWRELV